LIAGVLAALAFWGAFILFVRYAAAARKAAARPRATQE
jgi:hypothetical protein